MGAAGAHRAGNSDQLLRVHDVGRDLEARREHGNELIGLSLILKIFPTLGRFADDELQIDVERRQPRNVVRSPIFPGVGARVEVHGVDKRPF